MCGADRDCFVQQVKGRAPSPGWCCWHLKNDLGCQQSFRATSFHCLWLPGMCLSGVHRHPARPLLCPVSMTQCEPCMCPEPKTPALTGGQCSRAGASTGGYTKWIFTNYSSIYRTDVCVYKIHSQEFKIHL